jgi:hypothetical protein
MEWYEWILLPIYLITFWVFGFYIRDKLYANTDPTKRFFIIGLSIKMLGAIAYAFIYIYYYKGAGDTFAYFGSISQIVKSFETDPYLPFKLITDLDRFDAIESSYLTGYSSTEETFTVVRLGVPIAFFAFGSFTIITLFFSVISFTGSWVMYRTFYKANHNHPKAMAVACLMYPSVIFFGSGLLKDTVMMFAVGWLLYCCYHLFLLRKRVVLSMVMIPICVSLITSIKIYILLGFAPALMYWIFLEFPKLFKNIFLRSVVYASCLVGLLFGVFALKTLVESQFQQYSLDSIIGKIKSMQYYHLYLDGGSGTTSAYSLGDYDPSLAGLISKAPAAINVTFFRPYPSDITNPLVGIACLESMVILGLFILIILRCNWKIPIVLFKNNFIIFCFIFSVIFGFFVGFASYNFGALMRYKIPCLPFFLAAILLVYYNTIDFENSRKKSSF